MSPIKGQSPVSCSLNRQDLSWDIEILNYPGIRWSISVKTGSNKTLTTRVDATQFFHVYKWVINVTKLNEVYILSCEWKLQYSEVPNRRADRNKRADLEKSATLLAYLLSKLINEQSGIFRLLHEKLRAGWKENLKNLSEHVLLFGTSVGNTISVRFKQD